MEFFKILRSIIQCFTNFCETISTNILIVMITAIGLLSNFLNVLQSLNGFFCIFKKETFSQIIPSFKAGQMFSLFDQGQTGDVTISNLCLNGDQSKFPNHCGLSNGFIVCNAGIFKKSGSIYTNVVECNCTSSVLRVAKDFSMGVINYSKTGVTVSTYTNVADFNSTSCRIKSKVEQCSLNNDFYTFFLIFCIIFILALTSLRLFSLKFPTGVYFSTKVNFLSKKLKLICWWLAEKDLIHYCNWKFNCPIVVQKGCKILKLMEVEEDFREIAYLNGYNRCFSINTDNGFVQIKRSDSEMETEIRVFLKNEKADAIFKCDAITHSKISFSIVEGIMKGIPIFTQKFVKHCLNLDEVIETLKNPNVFPFMIKNDSQDEMEFYGKSLEEETHFLKKMDIFKNVSLNDVEKTLVHCFAFFGSISLLKIIRGVNCRFEHKLADSKNTEWKFYLSDLNYHIFNGHFLTRKGKNRSVKPMGYSKAMKSINESYGKIKEEINCLFEKGEISLLNDANEKSDLEEMGCRVVQSDNESEDIILSEQNTNEKKFELSTKGNAEMEIKEREENSESKLIGEIKRNYYSSNLIKGDYNSNIFKKLSMVVENFDSSLVTYKWGFVRSPINIKTERDGLPVEIGKVLNLKSMERPEQLIIDSKINLNEFIEFKESDVELSDESFFIKCDCGNGMRFKYWEIIKKLYYDDLKFVERNTLLEKAKRMNYEIDRCLNKKLKQRPMSKELLKIQNFSDFYHKSYRIERIFIPDFNLNEEEFLSKDFFLDFTSYEVKNLKLKFESVTKSVIEVPHFSKPGETKNNEMNKKELIDEPKLLIKKEKEEIINKKMEKMALNLVNVYKGDTVDLNYYKDSERDWKNKVKRAKAGSRIHLIQKTRNEISQSIKENKSAEATFMKAALIYIKGEIGKGISHNKKILKYKNGHYSMKEVGIGKIYRVFKKKAKNEIEREIKIIEANVELQFKNKGKSKVYEGNEKVEGKCVCKLPKEPIRNSIFRKWLFTNGSLIWRENSSALLDEFVEIFRCKANEFNSAVKLIEGEQLSFFQRIKEKNLTEIIGLPNSSILGEKI